MRIRLAAFICTLWAAGPTPVAAQGSFQQREQLSWEQRAASMEEQLAARTENVRDLEADIGELKSEMRTLHEQAKSAEDLSKSNEDRIDQISGIGRLILGAVAFLIGAIVTQFVSRLMAGRRPRVVSRYPRASSG
jgi:hypothetical protein